MFYILGSIFFRNRCNDKIYRLEIQILDFLKFQLRLVLSFVLFLNLRFQKHIALVYSLMMFILTEILSLAKNDIDTDISLGENDIDRDISLGENDIYKI